MGITENQNPVYIAITVWKWNRVPHGKVRRALALLDSQCPKAVPNLSEWSVRFHNHQTSLRVPARFLTISPSMGALLCQVEPPGTKFVLCPSSMCPLLIGTEVDNWPKQGTAENLQREPPLFPFLSVCTYYSTHQGGEVCYAWIWVGSYEFLD